jgi:hypothetical protein
MTTGDIRSLNARPGRYCGDADRHRRCPCHNACRDEGGADGGVIVQDSLQLTHSLLRKNSSNQRMFRCLHCASCAPHVVLLHGLCHTVGHI